MRTILVPLLAVYALVLTVYLGVHLPGGSAPSRSTGPSSTADVNLPVAPPFEATNSSPLSGKDLLARVAIENELRYTDLQSFVCSEQMERFRGHANGGSPRQVDTVTAQVSFENGVENYSAIQQNKHIRANMFDIPGAWSVGEFGTLLRQTRTLLTSQPLTSLAVSGPNGEPSMLYTMNVPGEESPWDLMVAKQRFRVPFRTEVLVAQNTGRIVRIKRTSTAMPPDFGISEIQWAVNLKPIPLDGKDWLLPTTGEYSVVYEKTNRREWNVIAFGDYHRYTASSVMHF
jgi:hypothetical protein